MIYRASRRLDEQSIFCFGTLIQPFVLHGLVLA
jgi:hypothetical protein